MRGKLKHFLEGVYLLHSLPDVTDGKYKQIIFPGEPPRYIAPIKSFQGVPKASLRKYFISIYNKSC